MSQAILVIVVYTMGSVYPTAPAVTKYSYTSWSKCMQATKHASYTEGPVRSFAFCVPRE